MNGLQPLAGRFSVCLALVPLVLAGGATFVMAEGRPTIAEKTEGMEVLDGFFPMYWDGDDGTLWMEIARFDSDLLYIRSLAAGVGSNDIGLDRGQIGASALVRFERVGPKVLMVQPNQRFHVETDNPDEVRSLEEAFATSVLWGVTVEAETDGAVLVDVTPFVLRDAHGAADRLPGTYRLDAALADAWASDIRYMTGQDTDANPRVHIWANGTDPATELHRMMDVRGAALARFGEGAVRNGTLLALLEEALVPLFLHHRFQIDDAASTLGGLDYIYAMRGDGRDPLGVIPAADQRAAPMAQVRAVSAYWLEDLVRRIDEVTGLAGLGGVEGRAHVDALRRDIRRFLDRPGGIAEPWEAPAVPPGSPIGDPGLRWLLEPFCSEPFMVTGW